MEIREIPIQAIKISKFNTRKDLQAGTEDSSLDDLASSIKEKGLLNPITVRKLDGNMFDLIAGQRRLLASKRIGLKTIPAIIRDVSDDSDATAISLIENVHRAEMSPIDKAKALKSLYERYKADYKKTSKETGISEQTIKKYLTLLELPDEILQRVSTSDGPAKIDALSTLAKTYKDPEEAIYVYEKTSGFSQHIQKEIIKRSGGNIDRLEELVLEAQEGAFDTKFCKGLEDCVERMEVDPKFPVEILTAVKYYVQGDKESLKDVIKRIKKTR